MATETPETTHSSSPYGCLVYIVGKNHFQNVLLADHIETRSQWKCAVVDNIAMIRSVHVKEHSNLTAVLNDSFVLSDASLIDQQLSELEQLPPDWALALFNLNPKAGIEKKALPCGIKGFFYQDDSADTLLKGLAAVFSGEIWLSRQMMAEVILAQSFAHQRNHVYSYTCTNDLTRREVEILAMLTHGATNKGISDKLCISPHTVRTHLNHIFRKIKVTSRLEASAWAVENLFIRNSPPIH